MTKALARDPGRTKSQGRQRERVGEKEELALPQYPRTSKAIPRAKAMRSGGALGLQCSARGSPAGEPGAAVGACIRALAQREGLWNLLAARALLAATAIRP